MSFKDLSLDEVLDDLSSRFIINVPDEEFELAERLCFQVEQAHWYYEDLVRQENPQLPSFSFRAFNRKCFEHSPLLQRWAAMHDMVFENFKKYKTGVPVCGAIVLNARRDRVLVVRGCGSRSWMFPRGKINRDESAVHCAVREVHEETGLDITPYLVSSHGARQANLDLDAAADCEAYADTALPPPASSLPTPSVLLVPRTHDPGGPADVSGARAPLLPTDTAVDGDYVYAERTIKGQRIRLYVAADVPDNVGLATRTRNEIAEIAWHPLSQLPGVCRPGGAAKAPHYFMAAPFSPWIRNWLARLPTKKSPRRTTAASVIPTQSVCEPSSRTQHPLRDFSFDMERILDCFRRAIAPSSSVCAK